MPETLGSNLNVLEHAFAHSLPFLSAHSPTPSDILCHFHLLSGLLLIENLSPNASLSVYLFLMSFLSPT